MEINGKQPLASLDSMVQRLEAQQNLSLRAVRPDAENRGVGSDRVELSVRGLQVQHLDQLIRSTPDVREARVEEIRNLIQSGTYNVRGEQIAEKIISGSLVDEVF
jgi:negative regulator of flagellin synthesis FlgM